MTNEERFAPPHWVWVGVVVAVTLALFWPAIFADFVLWDDDVNLFANPHIQGLKAENLRWMFTDVAQTLRYKPLNWLAWAGIHEVAGLRPGAFHLANVLLHTVNAALTAGLLLSLVARACPGLARREAGWGAVIGALVWSLHPLRVEPVAWATGLPYLLALGFTLVSLRAYWQFACTAVDQPHAPAGRKYWFAVGAYWLGLLSYPNILGLATVPVAMDWWLARKHNQAGPWLKLRHGPFLLGAGILVGMQLAGRFTAHAFYAEAPTLGQVSGLDRLLRGGAAWLIYLGRHIWTSGLSVIYEELLDFHAGLWAGCVSALVVLGLTAGAYLRRQRGPLLWLLWVSHLAWLVPMLGLTENEHMAADRYTYASGLLVGLLVTAGLTTMAGSRWWRISLLGAGTAVVFFAWQTSGLIPVWRDSGRLFRHVLPQLERADQRSLVWGRLGAWHQLRGELAAAELAYTQALDGARDRTDILIRVAEVIAQQGRWADALPHYEQAVAARPSDAGLRQSYSQALRRLGREVEAQQQDEEFRRLTADAAKRVEPMRK